MDQKSFESTYATNGARSDIYNEFLAYLATVQESLSSYSLLVFGSFVGGRDEPNDMDILLHGYVHDGALPRLRIEQLQSRGRIHVKLEVSAMKSDFKPRSHQDLANWFEKSNPGKKVGKYEAIDF